MSVQKTWTMEAQLMRVTLPGTRLGAFCVTFWPRIWIYLACVMFCERGRKVEWKDGEPVRLPENISGKENVQADAEQAAVIVRDQHHGGNISSETLGQWEIGQVGKTPALMGFTLKRRRFIGDYSSKGMCLGVKLTRSGLWLLVLSAWQNLESSERQNTRHAFGVWLC